MIARALTIAGSDPSGGAGIAQDLRTFHAFGVWGMTAITAVTVQDTTGVHGWHSLSPSAVREQIDVVVRDIGVDALKTGMIPAEAMYAEIAEAIDVAGISNVVVDPVLTSSSGDPLAEENAVTAMREVLFPRTLLVTPNIDEARTLTGLDVRTRAAQIEAARAVRAMGARAALVTGGHLDGTDVLVDEEGDIHELSHPLVATKDTHGTGCVLSAAITAGVARGDKLIDAVAAAKRYVTRAIEDALRIGKGTGPVRPPREA